MFITLSQLNWLPLVKRRKQQRLNLFYQIMHGEIDLSLPEYIHFTTRHTRHHASPVSLDCATNKHHYLHDKLLSKNHPGMEFTAIATN